MKTRLAKTTSRGTRSCSDAASAGLGDDSTDLYDMALFNDLFAAGARRVDMNIDGETDSADAAIYDAAYSAATGP